MPYRTRSVRRVAQKSRTNFILTLLMIGGLIYATIFWILPGFIGSVGFITDILNPASAPKKSVAENPLLAPPVLNIPYEATNTATLNISGYSTPNSQVKLYVDSELVDITSVDREGNFSTSGISLTLGTNSIFGKTVDEKDQESLPSKTIEVLYDSDKPKLEVTSPSDGASITGERKIQVTGKTEPEAKVFINDNRAIVNSDGNFTYTLSLNDGENNLKIKALDNATNITEVERKVTFSPS